MNGIKRDFVIRIANSREIVIDQESSSSVIIDVVNESVINMLKKQTQS